MRFRNLAGFAAALLIGALCGSLIGPHPVQAVSREIVELQRDVTTLLQGQKDLGTQITQDHTVMRTLIEQSNDTVGKLNGTMSGLQKLCRTFKPTPVRVSTPCPLKFKDFPTISRKLNRVSAS
jgi:hypothetical protein